MSQDSAFEKGWRACAVWASRDDLVADIGSPAYLRTRDAALTSAPKEQAEPVTTHTAWMIEAKGYGRPLWFNGTIDHEMTDDPNAAIRFPTKAAAEFFFTLLRVERPRRFFKGDISVYEITEHQWLATQPERLGPCGGDAVEEGMRLAEAYSNLSGLFITGHEEALGESIKASAALRAHLSRMAGADAGAEPSQAARDVLAERERQINVEGWTPEHDDQHTRGGMAVAAACYAAWTLPSRPASEVVSTLWPWTGWASNWFKPKDTRHNLIRAGALILAEIERLDRAAATAGEPKP